MYGVTPYELRRSVAGACKS